MKKFLLLIVSLFVTVFTLASCGNAESNPTTGGNPTSGSGQTQTTSPSGTTTTNPGGVTTGMATSCSHNYGDWTIETEPTETTKGLAKRRCSECGNTETMELPELSEESYTITASTTDSCMNNYALKTNNNIVVEVINHTGEIFCEGCGLDLTTDEFWTKLQDTSNYESIVLSIDQFSLNLGPVSAKIQNALLEIDLDNDNFVKALGCLTKVDEDEDSGDIIMTTYYFEFEDMKLYTASQVAGHEMNYGDIIDFSIKDKNEPVTEATALTGETETSFKLNRENIIKALYFLTNVTKDEEDNLVIEIDWDKIKELNKGLYENTINELVQNTNDINLSEMISQFIDMASMVTIKDLVNMYDTELTEIETKINGFLASIPQNAIPESLTTVTDLIKHILVQSGLVPEELDLSEVVTIKDLLLALDPSTDTLPVTIGDIILSKLGYDEKPADKTYQEVIKEYITSIVEYVGLLYNIDGQAVMKLFEDKLDTILEYIPYNLTITQFVEYISESGIFDQIDMYEAMINEMVLSKLNQLFPLDTTSISNLITGILVKTDVLTEDEALKMTSIKDLISLLDNSTLTERDTLDKVLVRLLGINLEANETEKDALKRIVNGYLNKNIYEIIAGIEFINASNKTAEQLYTIVNGSIDAFGLGFAPALTLKTDGELVSAELKLVFGEFECNIAINFNTHITMPDIINIPMS